MLTKIGHHQYCGETVHSTSSTIKAEREPPVLMEGLLCNGVEPLMSQDVFRVALGSFLHMNADRVIGKI